MKTIYIKLLFILFLLPFNALAQSSLTGVVIDSKTQKPLSGVNVILKSTAKGTSTDFDGSFTIKKLNMGEVITFSLVGYRKVTRTFDGSSKITVTMQEETNELQEVVVQVGYGSVKKKDATGSVELITTKDFNKGPITSVDGLLNGRAAGVSITPSGTPGNNATIRIRGGSSLAANNDPLIVVDGLPLNSFGDNTSGGKYNDSGLSSINPNDIETFSILKDASATAIYGNRGSNGVIIITTKKGSKKGLQISLNTFTTLNTLDKKIDVYSADEFRSLIGKYAPSKVNMLGNANTDWQKEIFKNSFSSDVSLSLTGNLFKTIPSRLTIGNTDNNGILLTSSYKRTTVSTSLNPSFFDDHLKLNITGNYSYTFKRKADEGAIGSAVSYDPTKPVYNDDPLSSYNGYNEWMDTSTGLPKGGSNPVSMLLDKNEIENVKRYYGNINIDYKFHFLPQLHAVLNAGLDNNDFDSSNTTDPLARGGLQGVTIGTTGATLPIGYYETRWAHSKNKNISYQLNYAKAFGKLNVDALAGYNYQEFEYEDYHTGNINAYGYTKTSEAEVSDIYTSPGNKLDGIFSRANVGFDDKYLLTVNFRRDGSSKVSNVNQYSNFMGYAFAWKLKQESFLKDSKVFSDLKLRLGYGEVGQQDLPESYDWFKRYNTSNNNYYQFGNDFVIISKPEGYNENLKWETSKKYNIGLDFGFLNNKLKGSVDFYLSKTTDLFSKVAEGALQNLRIYGYRNIGSLESKGIDFALNYNPIRNDKFDLSFNYNVTYNHLELTDLFSDGLLVGGLGLQQFTQIHKVGLAPNSYWVYQQVYDAAGKPIEGVFVDRNGDGVVDSNDKYNYKKPQADVVMGFMTNITFLKNWDFSMAWKASFGNYVYDKVSAERASLDAINNTVGGTLNNSPMSFDTSEFSTGNSSKESDYYIKNASFLKLNNVTLGYRFNSIFGEKINVRFYTGIQNVLTITKYNSIDPEVFDNGIDGTIYPRARMYTFGVNANF